MQKQKKRHHYKILLTALGLSMLIVYSCRKIELSVSPNAIATEIFFTVSPNINPSVKKVVDKLKSINTNKEFVSSFANKEGFAIWDKAMVTVTNHKKSGRFSTSRNLSNSTNGYDTTITIPVVLNSTSYVNAAIVATINDSISLSLFRGRDYSKLPYGNHGVDTFTAEKYAVQFMKLEKIVFGTNSFLLTDHNLFSYLLNNNNGRTSLLSSSFDITMSAGDCVDWINILYNNPDMIINNGTITCVGFEQGGGLIDTHMPPIVNTGGVGSTGGSSGAPTNPVGGGNNNNGLGWVPVDDETPDPCPKAQEKAKKMDSLFTQSKADSVLGTITNLATEPKEQGFPVYKKIAVNPFNVHDTTITGYSSGSVQIGTDSTISITATTSNLKFLAALLHTHPSKGYSAHSAKDVFEIIGEAISNNHYQGSFVAAANGSQYALTVTNLSQANAFYSTMAQNLNGAKWEPSSDIGKDFDKATKYFEDIYNSDPNKTNLAYEMAMAAVLTQYNVGITLNKKDASGNFKPLIVKTEPDPRKPKRTKYTQQCN